MGIKRVRLDSQGLLIQSEKGKLSRIPLSKKVLKEAFQNPTKFLEKEAEKSDIVKSMYDSNKILTAKFDVFPEDLGFLSRPIRTYYGIEPGCNLACTFCGPRDFHEGYAANNKERESFFLKEIADSGCFQVQFTGGEIFLRGEQVLDLVKKANDLGLAVILSTNGVWKHIKDKRGLVKRIARVGNVIQTKISIEGTKEFHESVRGKGTYASTLETLKLLSEFGLNPRISSTIFKESCNKKNLLHLVKVAKKYSAGLQVIPLRVAGLAKTMVAQVPSKEQLEEYTKLASLLREKEKVKISFNFDIYSSCTKVPRYDTESNSSCGAPLMGLHITHTGGTYACGFAQELPEFMCGVISPNTSYLSIWRNSEVIKKFRIAKKSSACQKCNFYGAGCWGGCWVMSYMSAGKINGMDPYCPTHGSTEKLLAVLSKKKDSSIECQYVFRVE